MGKAGKNGVNSWSIGISMILVYFFILGFYFLKLVAGYMLYNRADCKVQI